MSGIKMSEVFDLPLHVDITGVIFDNDSCAIGEICGTLKQSEAVGHAINTHDTMQARIVELESLIKEADDYLNTNKLTTICNGSILHMAFKEALKDEKGS